MQGAGDGIVQRRCQRQLEKYFVVEIVVVWYRDSEEEAGSAVGCINLWIGITVGLEKEKKKRITVRMSPP